MEISDIKIGMKLICPESNLDETITVDTETDFYLSEDGWGLECSCGDAHLLKYMNQSL